MPPQQFAPGAAGVEAEGVDDADPEAARWHCMLAWVLVLGTIGILLYVPMVVLVMSHALIARRRATADDLAAHARDYPCARVPLRRGEEGAADAAAIAAATGTSRR